MGFVNTKHNYTITNDSLVKGYQDRLKNPFYMYTEQKPTTVTYWNINATKTSLDPGIKQSYAEFGIESSYRYNKVNNFVLYGIPRIQLNFSITENGMEADPIEGEAIIIPNTIVPVVDDCFKINYLKEKGILFKVTKIDRDTMDNGANFYKISYILEETDEKYEKYLNSIMLAEEFEYIPGNVGTNFAALIKSSDKTNIERLTSLYETLQSYYVDLFYKPSIQTFTYLYNDMWLYDPYIIEFMIRQGLFIKMGEFLYLDHLASLSSTFRIEYDSSIFRYVEKRNPRLKICSYYPILITDVKCTMSDRLEPYYQLSNNKFNMDIFNPIININKDLQDRIIQNLPYDENDPGSPIYRNIIINYMNTKGTEYNITEKELDNLETLNYCYNKDLFYEIPLLMFVIYAYILQLQSDNGGEPIHQCYITRR